MDWNEPFKSVLAKLMGWGREAILALPNLAAALFVFLAFWLLARLVRRGTTRLLARTSAPRQIQRLLVSLAGMLALATGLFVALGILQLDKALASLLAGAGILGLALSFAVQDITANFISGIFLAIRRPFRIGELIETHGFQGLVERIELRSTVLKRATGQIVIIPNKMVFEGPILNFTVSGERRVDLEIGVSYSDDLDKVEQVTRTALAEVPQRNTERPVEVFFTAFGASAIQLRARLWLRHTGQADDLAARSEAIKRIKRAYEEARISIPFPVQTLDLSLGGAQLNELMQGMTGAKSPGGPDEAEGKPS